MTEGIRHIVGEPLLKHTLVALGLCILVLGLSESLIFAVADAFGKPVEYIGFMLTIQGVGAIAGGLTAPRSVRRPGETGALTLSLAVLALGLAVIAVAPTLWLVLVGVAIFGYSLPLMMIAFSTLMQLRTPGRLMGRVSTATDVVLGTPQTLSIAGDAFQLPLSVRRHGRVHRRGRRLPVDRPAWAAVSTGLAIDQCTGRACPTTAPPARVRGRVD